MGCGDNSVNDFVNLTQDNLKSLFGSDMVNEKSTLEKI